MVRIGEDIVIVESDSGTIGIIGGREIGIGKKIVSLPSDGVPISVRQFNTYVGDDGVSIPLPCGSRVFIPAEPPNYLPPAWESGFGMSCQQGNPYTDGWSCSDACPIHPVTNLCKRGANGGSVNIYDAGFCVHPTYKSVWIANKDNNWVWSRKKYYCPQQCPYRRITNIKNGVTTYHWCPGWGTQDRYSGGTDTWYYEGRYGGSFGSMYPAAGCDHPPSRLGPVEITKLDSGYNPARDFYNCYGGAGGICKFYNGGAGTPPCPIGPNPKETFPRPSKPARCANPMYISFLGWIIPGGENSTGASCVLQKATEGAANRSSGPIRCKFSYPTGEEELSGQGDLRLPISPTNLEGDGKAGTPLSATASISISGEVNLDYTRIPTRKTSSGTVCAFTQGRY